MRRVVSLILALTLTMYNLLAPKQWAYAASSNALNAFGTLLQRGDGAGTEVFTTIAELQNVEIPGVETDILDVTHHTSPGAFKEFVLGLRDGGEVTVEGSYVPKEATQNATTGLLADNLSGVKRNFKCIFSDAVAAVKASLAAAMTDPNANIIFTAATAGTAGNATTVTFAVAGNNTALSIGVAGSAITVTVATNGSGAAVSTADQVIAAIAASGPATALVIATRGMNANGAGVVNARALANLTGGLAAVAGTVWSFTAYVRNFVARAPHDGKLSFRATLKVTGQPTLA
jgi:hypothetical protein